MRHYARNIGDLAAATRGLDLLHRGAYDALLDAYYLREAPLPLDARECYVLADARSPAERRAVDTVIARFFVRQDDGYHQRRCDRELARFGEKSEKARASAEARWSHSGRNANAHANASSDAMRPQSERNATHDPRPTTHNPKVNTKGSVAAPPLPDWLDPQAWQRFLEARVAMKARPTEHAKHLLILDLTKLREQGHDPTAVLEQSIKRSWKGVFPIRSDNSQGQKADRRTAFADAVIGATHGSRSNEADPRDISGEAERVA